VRNNGWVPQNDSAPVSQPSAEPEHSPAQAAGATEQAAPAAEPAAPAAPRAPLPGEPGFKAPLTEKQLKRANQTIKGMFISVGLTLAVVLPVVFLNPGSSKDTYTGQHVDQAAVAQAAQQNITTQGFQALNPSWPEGWYVNRATWNAGAADGVGYWSLGVIKDNNHYGEVLQTDAANPSWISLVTDGSLPTGATREIDGVAWEERTLASEKKPKSLLVAKIDGYTYIVRADGGDEGFLGELAGIVQHGIPDAASGSERG
jgi:hypothetical protein